MLCSFLHSHHNRQANISFCFPFCFHRTEHSADNTLNNDRYMAVIMGTWLSSPCLSESSVIDLSVSPLRKVGNGCLYSWQDSYLQKLIIFYTRTWQWIMTILETAGIACVLPASNFGLFAFVIQTCGLKTFLSAVNQSVIKHLATKNYAQQSRLSEVKRRSSSESRCGFSGVHTRLSVLLACRQGSAGSPRQSSSQGWQLQGPLGTLMPVLYLPLQQLIPAHPTRFSLLWLRCTMLFLIVFCYWYADPGVLLLERTAKARDNFREVFSMSLRSQELSVYLWL